LRILVEGCHRFWWKVATDSGGRLPSILMEGCHRF
jgi:hypothetical protein